MDRRASSLMLESLANLLPGGGVAATPLLNTASDRIDDAYSQDRRGLHGNQHAYDMATLDVTERQELRHNIQASSTTERESEVTRVSSLISLAGLYHDVIYLAPDNGAPLFEDALRHYINFPPEAGNSATAADYRRSTTLTEDQLAQMDPLTRQTTLIVYAMFDLEPGQPIPTDMSFGGGNEFLSALVAAHDLRTLLTAELVEGPERDAMIRATVAQVASIIEGTIPFRGAEHFEHIYEKLNDLREDPVLGFEGAVTVQQLANTTRGNVIEANKDVGGIAGGLGTQASEAQKLGSFLDGTWSMFKEQNPAYLGPDVSPTQYRQTLEGGMGFLPWFFSKAEEIGEHAPVFTPAFLRNPQTGEAFPAQEGRRIFHAFQGDADPLHQVPSPTDLTYYENSALNNIYEFGQEYFQAKIAAVALVEAIAAAYPELAGLSLKELVHGMQQAAENYRQTHDGEITLDERQRTVLAVLTEGRGGTSADYPFDIDQSPIASLLYQFAGPDAVKEIFDLAQAHFPSPAPGQQQNAEAAMSFLNAVSQSPNINMDVLHDIAGAIGQTIGRNTGAHDQSPPDHGVQRNTPELLTVIEQAMAAGAER